MVFVDKVVAQGFATKGFRGYFLINTQTCSTRTPRPHTIDANSSNFQNAYMIKRYVNWNASSEILHMDSPYSHHQRCI